MYLGLCEDQKGPDNHSVIVLDISNANLEIVSPNVSVKKYMYVCSLFASYCSHNAAIPSLERLDKIYIRGSKILFGKTSQIFYTFHGIKRKWNCDCQLSGSNAMKFYVFFNSPFNSCSPLEQGSLLIYNVWWKSITPLLRYSFTAFLWLCKFVSLWMNHQSY